jgi:hypothetical protein
VTPAPQWLVDWIWLGLIPWGVMVVATAMWIKRRWSTIAAMAKQITQSEISRRARSDRLSGKAAEQGKGYPPVKTAR